MRNASGALQTFLASGTEFYVADLLTIVPLVGSIVRITSFPIALTATSQYDNASHAFTAGGNGVPTFRRGTTKLVVGLEVDALTLTIDTNASTPNFGSGLTWATAARVGLLDGATIVLERAFMPTQTDTSKGTLITFWGRVGEVRPSRSAIALVVQSELALLGLSMPRNIYQPKCLHVLYDTGCTLNKATFTTTGIVSAGSTSSAVKTNLTAADNYYALGTITFTSGALNGLSFSVKSYANANGLVTPVARLIAAPQTGDTFSIVPGCDKTQATCTTKFANLAHFRGYPYVPAPESAG